jgi:hypothetical protein
MVFLVSKKNQWDKLSDLKNARIGITTRVC